MPEIFSLNPGDKDTYRSFAGMSCPRHTSYPAVPYWKHQPQPEDIRHVYEAVRQRNHASVYVHIPFCRSLCYYCGCTRDIIGPQSDLYRKAGERFLSCLRKEAECRSSLTGKVSIKRVHLGGGTPTFLSPVQLRELMDILSENFRLSSGEWSVEIDPRVTGEEHILTLAELGFNRASFGIQDFDPVVQKTVNRIQPVEMVQSLLDLCRDQQFSINFDLICGLPGQTSASVKDTIETVISMDPDRIAWYRLAMIPGMFKWQKQFKPEDLPDENEILSASLMAVNLFRNAGYQFVGLDHFAKREDDLSRAFLEETLVRNFQGMTTGKGLDIIGLGPSAISQFREGYIQNPRDTKSWESQARDPFVAGSACLTDRDDRIRHYVIENLYCYGYVDKIMFKKRFRVSFDDYFQRESDGIRELCSRGLVEVDHESLSLTRVLGRLLVRVVASRFDSYFTGARGKATSAARYSRIG